jgi:hypothetical protein
VSAPPSPPPNGEPPQSSQNVAAALAEVSERASVLVREEIELAKAEVSEKLSKLMRGAVVGAAAGVFVLTALVFALTGCAWLLYYYLPVGTFAYFWGFFAMAVILLLLGALAGVFAAKAVKKGTPPVPNMALEEARKIKETVSAGAEEGAGAAGGAAPGEGSQPGAEVRS